MSPEPMNVASREMLTRLSELLLEQHKLLLDCQRAEHEHTNGRVSGPGAFLSLVLNDPEFAWLRKISGLIVAIDEALAPRATAGQAEADTLTAQARELMRPLNTGPDFQVRYYRAVQASPDLVILQVRIERLLTGN